MFLLPLKWERIIHSFHDRSLLKVAKGRWAPTLQLLLSSSERSSFYLFLDFNNASKELHAIILSKMPYWAVLELMAICMRLYSSLLFFISAAICISLAKSNHQVFSISWKVVISSPLCWNCLLAIRSRNYL